MDTRISQDIASQAARWHARLGALDCSAADRDACERWRRADPRHAAAWDEAVRASAGVRQLLAVDPRLQALAQRALAGASSSSGSAGPPTCRRTPRRWVLPAALAATALLAIVGARVAMQPGATAQPMVYANTSVQQQRLVLEDGSVVYLDVGSRIDVQMDPRERRIQLVNGRALFDVAHDTGRPFSVMAGGARTVALGTRFQVQRDEARVVVTLEEGSVAVSASTWQERLVPGEQMRVATLTGEHEKQQVDPQIVTSWSSGRHIFRGTPLAEAVEEVNRYATRKVRLGDSSLAELSVGGSFLTGNSELIASAFAAVLPVRVVDGGNEIILFRRYDTEVR